MSDRIADTSAPVIDVIATRWSPRSFDSSHELPEGELRSVFEAARWAASASNTQPWRFIIARRGTETFAKVQAALVEFNQMWAANAAVLVVNVAVTANTNGEPQIWAEYDLGQAVASYSLQAQADGLYAHQMGGFDAEALRTSFDLAATFKPVSVTAIGKLDAAHKLPDFLEEREVAPRERKALDELVIVND